MHILQQYHINTLVYILFYFYLQRQQNIVHLSSNTIRIMSEIISIHVGGCGVNVGLSYWRQLAIYKQQHEDDSRTYYNRLYSEEQNGKLIPRTIFIDSDIRSNVKVSCSEIQFNFNSVLGYGNSCSVYAEGKYSEGNELKEPFQQSLRNEIEKCDCLSGFIVTRSPTGGCGSGVGSNVISQINEHHADKIIEQFKIMPGFNYKFGYNNLNPIQIYNTVLTNLVSVMDTKMVYTLETNAVQQILERRGIKNCGLKEVNQYLGRCLTEHVSAYMEPGYLNTSQRKRMMNLVPFYRVKHMTVGLSEPNVRNSLRSALDIDNRLCIFDERTDKKIYTISVNIRQTESCETQTYKKIQDWRQKTSNETVNWLPKNYHISFSKTNISHKQRAYAIINSSKNIHWIRQISQKYFKLIKSKPFFQNYTSRGMEQIEFIEAKQNLTDSISDYDLYDGNFDDEDPYT